MRPHWHNSIGNLAALWLLGASMALAADAGNAHRTEPPHEPAVLATADQWLAAVRERLPRQPTWIAGWLSTDGQPMFNLEMLLDLGHQPPLARYALRDAFGADLEEITLWRHPDETRVRYRQGSSLRESEAPDLFSPIRNTAMSWGDLSLSFLWWENGTLAGQGEVRGRECVIIEVEAPDTEAGLYHTVRLWIDRQHRMLLQAEGYDIMGRLVRRMQVRSFRKIDDEWMVKDIVIRRYPGTLRTNLRVRDMGVLTEPSAPERD